VANRESRIVSFVTSDPGAKSATVARNSSIRSALSMNSTAKGSPAFASGNRMVRTLPDVPNPSMPRQTEAPTTPWSSAFFKRTSWSPWWWCRSSSLRKIMIRTASSSNDTSHPRCRTRFSIADRVHSSAQKSIGRRRGTITRMRSFDRELKCPI